MAMQGEVKLGRRICSLTRMIYFYSKRLLEAAKVNPNLISVLTMTETAASPMQTTSFGLGFIMGNKQVTEQIFIDPITVRNEQTTLCRCTKCNEAHFTPKNGRYDMMVGV